MNLKIFDPNELLQIKIFVGWGEGKRMDLTSLGLLMYQRQSQVNAEEEIVDARSTVDSESDIETADLGAESEFIGVPAGPGLIADAENSFLDLNYVQWILLLIGIMLLIALVVWFTDNFGARLENLKQRFRRTRSRDQNSEKSFESLIAPPLEESNFLPSADDFLEPIAADQVQRLSLIHI